MESYSSPQSPAKPKNPIADNERSRKPPIAPVLWDMPLPTGAQLFLFASDWYDGYPSWAAGPDTSALVNVAYSVTPGPA